MSRASSLNVASKFRIRVVTKTLNRFSDSGNASLHRSKSVTSSKTTSTRPDGCQYFQHQATCWLRLRVFSPFFGGTVNPKLRKANSIICSARLASPALNQHTPPG